jgi:uncharacterized protein (DUF736 family)
MEQKDNSAALFFNDRKRSENSPDFSGKALINGKTIYVSCWKKVAKNGSEYLSLSFTEPKKEDGNAPF